MANIEWTWPITFFLTHPDPIIESYFHNDPLAKSATVLFLGEQIWHHRPPINSRSISNVIPERFRILIINGNLNTIPPGTKADIILLQGFIGENERKFLRFKAAGHVNQLLEHFSGSEIIFLGNLSSASLLERIAEMLNKFSRNENPRSALHPVAIVRTSIEAKQINWDNPLQQSLNYLITEIKSSKFELIYIPKFHSGQRAYTKSELSRLVQKFADNALQHPDQINLSIFSTINKVLKSSPIKTHIGEGRKFKSKNLTHSTRPTETMSFSTIAGEPAKAKPKFEPRFLQCIVQDVSMPATILNFLRPHSRHQTLVKIGLPDPVFLNPLIEFPDKKVFLSEDDTSQIIQIQFQMKDGKIEQKQLSLPKKGNSLTIAFDFKTKEEDEQFFFNILAFHKGRILQSIRIAYPVSSFEIPDLKPSLEIADFSVPDLEHRSEYGGSLMYDDRTEEPRISGIIEREPFRFDRPDGLLGIVNYIKTGIEHAAKNINLYPADLSAPKNTELLKMLAFQGSSLFKLHLQSRDIPSPIQLSTAKAIFIPLPFVYDLPAPELDATLCTHAATSLRTGKCSNCFDKTLNPSPHICPFGFWGYSKVIEFHRPRPYDKDMPQEDYLAFSGPNSKRNTLKIFDQTIHGSAKRMEAVTSGLRETVATNIGSLSSLHVAEDWKDWEEITKKHRPDSIILIVHVEKHKQMLVNQIEIGDQQLLLQNYISEKHISKEKTPLAIVIGCEVSDMDEQGFDVGSSFFNEGASIVITNFTQITGTQAAQIVSKLVDFFKMEKGNTVNLGEIMLKLRQHLLADGIITSLSLITYGDADWKLKL